MIRRLAGGAGPVPGRDGHPDPRRDVSRDRSSRRAAAGATRRPRQAVDLAAEAGCRRLVLFHHEPEHDDDALDRLLDDTRGYARRRRRRAGGRGGRGRHGAFAVRPLAALALARGRLLSGAAGGAAGQRPHRRAAVREHRLLRPGQGSLRGHGARPGRDAGELARRGTRAWTSRTTRRQNEALKALDSGPASGWTRRPPRRSARQVGGRTSSPETSRDFYGKFRINARVVDAETGQILKVVSNDDPKLQDRAQLSAIVQRLGETHHQGGRPATRTLGRPAGHSDRCDHRVQPRTALRDPRRPGQGSWTTTSGR